MHALDNKNNVFCVNYRICKKKKVSNSHEDNTTKIFSNSLEFNNF